MANARTSTVPIEGAIATFRSEVKLEPCTSVLWIVLHDIIINTVYIASPGHIYSACTLRLQLIAGTNFSVFALRVFGIY